MRNIYILKALEIRQFLFKIILFENSVQDQNIQRIEQDIQFKKKN